jgi:16S rRNA (guanine527-N7)-methyltransferase
MPRRQPRPRTRRSALSEYPPELLRALADAKELGIIGPAPLAEHIDHARQFGEILQNHLPDGGRLLDLGSGGGIPGLVVAALFPKFSLTLLEGRTEQAKRLEIARQELDVPQAPAVVGTRAEDAGRSPALRGAFDAVVARGFGPPATTAECGSPFLRVGGYLLVSEPPADAGRTPDRWPANGCRRLNLRIVEVVERPRAFVLLEQVNPCPTEFPRRVGVPRKRPLF